MIDSNSDRLQLSPSISSKSPYLLSENLSPIHSSTSFEDHTNSLPLQRGKAGKLIDMIDEFLSESSENCNELIQPSTILAQAKSGFLKLAEKEADREVQEKKFEIERQKESLNCAINELKNQKKILSNALAVKEGVTSGLLTNVQGRIEKAIVMMNEVKYKKGQLGLDLEIVEKGLVLNLREKIKRIERELERLKLRPHELTPDTARLQPKASEGLESLEEIDSIICSRIKDLFNLLQCFMTSAKPQAFAFSSQSPDFDPSYPLQCFDLFRVLEQKILAVLKASQDRLKLSENESERLYSSLKKISPGHSYKSSEDKDLDNLNLSNQALNRLNHEQAQEIQQLKSSVSKITQDYYSIQQKLLASKARENDLNLALRNKELSFEEKISEIRTESQTDALKVQMNANDNHLKLKIAELEQQLKQSNESNSLGFERELENVRKIYNDKYEELFKITSSQIAELEMKLTESVHAKEILTEEVRASLRIEENKLRDQEFQRLNQIHNRELRLVQSEFEDFLMNSKTEISKLGRLVEKAINSSDIKILGGLQEDIKGFKDILETRAKRVKEDSVSLNEDERICRRCGLNDIQNKFCNFHPYLSNANHENLYDEEWYQNREGSHNKNSTPCFRSKSHFYTSEPEVNNQKFFKKPSTDAISFSGSRSFKLNPSTPSQTLHDALFSTSKKSNPEASATDLLDSYISKYT